MGFCGGFLWVSVVGLVGEFVWWFSVGGFLREAFCGWGSMTEFL